MRILRMGSIRGRFFFFQRSDERLAKLMGCRMTIGWVENHIYDGKAVKH